MCGIAGIAQLDESRSPAAGVLPRMLETIFHRGPDDEGALFDGPIAMGMRRLSIIDLTDGKQPIFDESGRYAIVFNGEIYNYRELREDLIRRGHRFRTQSDTEVIVHLFEDHGPACLDHLRGMFGFAVWDKKKRELFIARDRLGIKPLYYVQTENALIFGSEIKSLLQHPDVSASLDHQSLAAYLSLKYVPAPRTMFEGIRSLPPAHSLTVSDGEVDIQRYWDVSYDKPSHVLGESEYADQLDAELRDSIRLRLRSDVPFGAFLSGGVDSSIIVALMSEMLDDPVKTFSVGFCGGDEPDELGYAQTVADHFGCEHHTLVINGNDFVEHAESVLWHLDQPIADQATAATHMVAKLARGHVKMVLTGEGGDELFAGYARYVGNQYEKLFRPLPRFAGKLVRSAADLVPHNRRAKIAINALTQRDEATRLSNWFPLLSDDSKQALLSSRMRAHDRPTAKYFSEQLARCDAQNPLDRMLHTDCNLWLPDYLLLRGDKLSMANSLEARVPLLDHKLVEFAAKLPTKMKLNGKTRKYLLKKVAERYLPSEIIHRRKQGFSIPIDVWMRNEAKPMVCDLLSPDVVRRRGLFQPNVVERLITRHMSGTHDHATELWGLMSVEMWQRGFVDTPVSPPAAPQHAAAIG
ncbi:MAG: asparagine synthase (glutamine-hydrolyzing) [Planctomycetota bacterium]